MREYKRTRFSMIKGIILAPFSGLLVFVLGQIFLPVPVCGVLGAAAAALIAYIAIFSENISFELEDDGAFRYFKRRILKNTFELPKYRIGYTRKTEWGLLGNNDITLKLLDGEGEETHIEAGPLGTAQFNEMFEAMEKYAIQDIETLSAEKP